MQSLLFVMAIMGCGESDAACREVRIDQQRFQSAAACQAATESALIRHSDLEFPTIVARCRPAGARPQLLRGSEVLLPAPTPARARYASARVARSSR